MRLSKVSRGEKMSREVCRAVRGTVPVPYGRLDCYE